MQTGQRTRKQYDEAYKLDAVALVNEQGYKLSEVARRLGINANMLSRWKQEFMQESTGQRLTADEREELTRMISYLPMISGLLATVWNVLS